MNEFILFYFIYFLALIVALLHTAACLIWEIFPLFAVETPFTEQQTNTFITLEDVKIKKKE